MKTISAQKFFSSRETSLEAVLPTGFVDISTLIPGYPKEQIGVFQEDYLLLPERISITPARRLVVMVPSGEVEEIGLARKVWKLASKSSLSVLYLALAPDSEYIPYLRRRLASLSASTAQGEVTCSIKILDGDDWANSLKKVMAPGDLMVSILGHRVPDRLLRTRSLGEFLCQSLQRPVYLLGGLRVGRAPQRSSMIRSLVGWSLSIATILGAGVFQIGISRATVDPYSTMLFFFTALIEIYLIWKINEWLD